MKTKILSVLLLFCVFVSVIELKFAQTSSFASNEFISSDFSISSYYKLLEQLSGLTQEEIESSPYIKLITVNYDGKISSHLTNKPTVISALLDLGYPLSNNNVITSTSTVGSIFQQAFVRVDTYTTTVEELFSDIPFTTEIQGAVLCQKLQRQSIKQEGVLGIQSTTIKKTYIGGEFSDEEVLNQATIKEPIPEIIVLEGPNDTPDSVQQRGYSCPFWESYVDGIQATDEEKQWLKFTMKMESGCNAESNKSYYKGLFQWDPCLWYSSYPNDNIFDGAKQIQRTLEKIRAGANPKNMWPGVYKQYVKIYGELSWLSN